MANTLRSRFTNWLMMPVTSCWQFMLMGTVAWLVLFHLTNWTSDPWWFWLPVLVADLYLTALIVCLFPKRWRKWIFATIYVAMYSLFFAESFIYQRYFTHFTPQTLAMIRETTPEETSGFLDICLNSSKLWSTLAWWGAVIALHVAIAVWGRKAQVAKWQRRAIIGIVAVSMIWWIPACKEIAHFLNLNQTELAERTNFSVFHSTFWRIVYSLKFESLTRQELKTLADNMHHINVEGHSNGIPYIIFVIGESYNKHHSAVYGYQLPTTPFQSAAHEDGTMIAMQDAVTPWNVTSMVFKQMLSTSPSDKKNKWTDGVLFPAIMRKGGYTVSFLSNQFYKSNRQTTADFNGSFFLNSQPFDSLCFDNRNSKHYLYDIGLTNSLPKDPLPQKQFIILHLLGQHQPYADRIPKGKGQFKIEDIKRPDLNDDERQIVADYDNATLMNDQVIEKTYNRFTDKEAIIIYVADHGEEVYDGNIGMFGRNHSAKPSPQIMWAEFEVPFEIFFTPTLAKKRPQLVKAAMAAQHKPCSIDDLSHTFINLAGIKCPYYNPQRDILSPLFKERKRYIKDLPITYDDIIKQK